MGAGPYANPGRKKTVSKFSASWCVITQKVKVLQQHSSTPTELVSDFFQDADD